MREGAVPRALPSEPQRGVMIGLASSGRLIPPELVVSMGCQIPPTQLNVGYFCAKGLPVDKAREFIADSAIKVKSKYLWFVDDDVLPPPNTLRRLVYILENNPNDVMVAGGIYCTKSDPPSPCIFREPGLGSFWNWKVGEVFEVHSMGAGCMMINCEVFNHLSKPYFPWPEELSNEVNGKNNMVSEDVSFCMAVRAAGFRIAAHGGILCDHMDTTTGRIYQLPLNSYPYKVEAKEPQEEVNSDKKE
jgi:hypothetical protein